MFFVILFGRLKNIPYLCIVDLVEVFIPQVSSEKINKKSKEKFGSLNYYSYLYKVEREIGSLN